MCSNSSNKNMPVCFCAKPSTQLKLFHTLKFSPHSQHVIKRYIASKRRWKKFLKSKLILSSSSSLLSFTVTLATNKFHWICQTLNLIFFIYYVDADNLVSIPSFFLKWYVTCHDNPMSISRKLCSVMMFQYFQLFIDHKPRRIFHH